MNEDDLDTICLETFQAFVDRTLGCVGREVENGVEVRDVDERRVVRLSRCFFNKRVADFG